MAQSWRPTVPRKKIDYFPPGPGPCYGMKSLIGFDEHDPSRKREPAYTMKFRNAPDWKRIGPGPYPIEQHLTHLGKDRPPAFTMAFRPRAKYSGLGPGPGVYETEKVPPYNHQRRAPAFKLVFKDRKNPYETPGPGPGAYKSPSCIGPEIPDIKAEGAFSMAFRPQPRLKAGTPGPADYAAVPLKQVKKRNPAFSMKFRHDDLRKLRGPGPQYDYKTELIKSKAPKFSFGVKYSPIASTAFTALDGD